MHIEWFEYAFMACEIHKQIPNYTSRLAKSPSLVSGFCSIFPQISSFRVPAFWNWEHCNGFMWLFARGTKAAGVQYKLKGYYGQYIIC